MTVVPPAEELFMAWAEWVVEEMMAMLGKAV